MKRNINPVSLPLFGFCSFFLLFVVLVAFSSQPHTPKDVVDKVIKEFPGPLPMDVSSSSYSENVKQELQRTGREGFLYMVEVVKQAPSSDLHRLIPALNYFHIEEADSIELVNVIRVRGAKAKEKDEIMAVAPLYANLGFTKMSPQVTHYLFDVIAKDTQIANDWPLMKELKTSKGIHEVSEVEHIIRTFAVLALFQTNTPETITFLQEIQNSGDISDNLKQTIAFFFQKVEEFGSLPEYYQDLYRKDGFVR